MVGSVAAALSLMTVKETRPVDYVIVSIFHVGRSN